MTWEAPMNCSVPSFSPMWCSPRRTSKRLGDL
uniref:Uncharacterized protein n=1 Tax=Anguilla anguilla TaxID=7936 RepID=A0A0E9XC68_ANGAN